MLEFNEHNQPRHGHLEGGVTMDSVSESIGRSRTMHGSSPTAELEFTSQGELRHAHLEREVELHSEEQTPATANSKTVPLRVSRTWKSPIADIEFRVARQGQRGHGQIEPATIRGTGGVVVSGENQRGKGAVTPSRMAADQLTGEFGAASALTAMVGVGHSSIEQTTATGTRQTTTGDRLEVHFAAASASSKAANANPVKTATGGGSMGSPAQIETAEIEGHVVLIQYPAPSPASKPEAQAAVPLRATAGRAVYEGQGEWLHLTLTPRVEDGGLQLTADKIDVSQASGDAFAQGNVKGTWLDNAKTGQQGDISAGKSGSSKAGSGGVALGGQGPAHVIAAEAQLHRATDEATFRGQARLWQQANSVAAPVIVLDRTRQTLVARSTDAAEPVRVVLLSSGSSGQTSSTSGDTGKGTGNKSTAPSVIRLRGGDLKYSDAERKAVMRGSALGTVVAETGTATSVSSEVELLLQPLNNSAGKDSTSGQGTGQVDRMTARGHVVLTSEGRRGTGEQLVYTGANGEYVLTGTAALPPAMSDPARGTVTGEALIFHSGDESVIVEGGQGKTSTDTRTPK
jgi:lipopolysaccharide export system protein LptA